MLPAGPPPTTHTALRWLSRPYELLDECAAQYGDRFTLDLGAYGRFVLVSTPSAIRDVFTGDPSVLHAGEGNAVMRAFLGPASLLLLEESAHLRERRFLAPAFHSRRVEALYAIVAAAAERELDSWVPGGEVVAQTSMQRISIDVILDAIFGVRGGARRDELRAALLAFLEDPKLNLGLMGMLDVESESPSFQSFVEQLAEIRELVRALVVARRADRRGDTGDVLSMLLDSTREDGSAPTDAEIEDELLTLAVTGFETTATALAWALSEAHAAPAVLAAVRERARSASVDELARDPYVDAVAREVLRLHPVIPLVARKARREIVVDGTRIPPGAIVAPCAYLAHRRAETYAEPTTFRPERFTERRFGPWEYLPFGGGARRCIGRELALAELRIVLALVLTRATLEPLGSLPPRPRRRSVTVAPDGGPRFGVARIEGRAHARTG